MSDRVMVIAHREELINQAADKIGTILGVQPVVEMAERRADDMQGYLGGEATDVVVASVQTLNSGRRECKLCNGKGCDKCFLGADLRMCRFDPQQFGLIIFDECHHCLAASYQRVVEWFSRNPECRFVGFTATPDRADEMSLGQVFQSVAFDYEINDAIDDGWLVPIEQRFVQATGIDLSGCKTRFGDLADGDVAKIMQQEEVIHEIIGPTLDIAGDRATMVFAASVEAAHKCAEILNRHRPESAIALDGTVRKDVRREQLKRFSQGKYQFLCNCSLFLEGFDEPRIEVVAQARPTKSRSLYAQCVGRGTRVLPGTVDGIATAGQRCAAIAKSAKPKLTVIDFVGNSGRHKLVCTADLLGGNVPDEVIDLAVSLTKKSGEAVDMQQQIEIAQQMIKEQEEVARLRAAKRRHVTPKVKYASHLVDPFGVFGLTPRRARGWDEGKSLSEKQMKVLVKAGMKESDVAKMNPSQASQLVGEVFSRREQNKCSFKQAKLLAKYGYSTDCGFSAASAIIDAVAKNGWKRPTETITQGV